MPRTPGSLPTERRLDKAHPEYAGQYAREPCYLVGIDETKTFREKIQEMYGDNHEITDVVSQLDEYFSDRSFGDRSEVQKFVVRTKRSIKYPAMADEIASELIDQGYVTALKRLGYADAPENVAFSKRYAEEHGISLIDAYMFGPSGAARIALAEWLVDERLHGMHRLGKGPGSAFSEETKQTWHIAEYKHRPWPHIEGKDGEFSLQEIPAEQGKLPQGTEELMRDSWRRYLYQGKDYAYRGMRRLRGEQNYLMIEDMVGGPA